MEMNFCRRCGTPLTHKTQHVYVCQDGHTIFANSAPTAGIFFLTEGGEVILSVRGIEPNKGMLDAFGGFVDGEERPRDAAVRELREELQLEPEDYEPLCYLTDGIGHYEYGGETTTTCATFYWTRLLPGKKPAPSDDVADTRTIPLHEVDLNQLHDDDIRSGLQALRELFPQ